MSVRSHLKKKLHTLAARRPVLADPLDKTVMASDLHGAEVLTETDSDGETTKAT